MFKMMREVQPEQSTNNTDVKSQIEALGARMYVGVQDRTLEEHHSLLHETTIQVWHKT